MYKRQTTCSAFGSSDKMKPLASMVKEGNRIKVAGNYEFDDYLRTHVIKVSSALAVEKPPVRTDDYPKKRVELHMHTKMSAMDGVSSIGDLVKRAAYWGHPAIAITDHGVAQGFPDARKAAQANPGVKMIYGMEGYLIDDISSAKLNIIREKKKGVYVVFDLETTGLSPQTEEITEIGAVKIKDGLIVDLSLIHIFTLSTPRQASSALLPVQTQRATTTHLHLQERIQSSQTLLSTMMI